MPALVFRFSFVASVLSLAAALAAQYRFGLVPCELCLMQRAPYAAVIVIALAAFIWLPCRITAFYLIVAAFVAGGCIATYHAAVEKHLVAGPTACTSATPSGGSVDDFIRAIKSAPVVACDRPQWEFHVLTMASLNAVWSFALAACAVLLVRKGKQDAKAAR